MSKPRRKNPGFNVIERSPQGRIFIAHLRSFLGDELGWKALEQTREKSTVFLVGGSRAWGVLVEAKEQAEGDRLVQRWGFRYYPEGTDMAAHMELLLHRWDPWLHADLTGDRSIVDGPRSRRYKLQEQRDWELGLEKDQYRLEILPRPLSRMAICDVPLELIDALVERCAEEEGVDHAPEDVDMPGSGGPWGADLLEGEFPLVA